MDAELEQLDQVYQKYLETLKVYDMWGYLEIKYIEFKDSFSEEYLKGSEWADHIAQYRSLKEAFFLSPRRDLVYTVILKIFK